MVAPLGFEFHGEMPARNPIQKPNNQTPSIKENPSPKFQHPETAAPGW